MSTRRRRFQLPPISLDRASPQPMYLQLCAALERAIQDGHLPAGSRLPSTRVAAKLLSISRTTVLTAYEMLAAEDQIEPAIGSGTRVRPTRMLPPVHAANWETLIRDARYPARVVTLQDPDGNLLHLNR
ncbi:MAG: GntR family transcriptional regulator [Bryobacteraceae bacterium]